MRSLKWAGRLSRAMRLDAGRSVAQTLLRRLLSHSRTTVPAGWARSSVPGRVGLGATRFCCPAYVSCAHARELRAHSPSKILVIAAIYRWGPRQIRLIVRGRTRISKSSSPLPPTVCSPDRDDSHDKIGKLGWLDIAFQAVLARGSSAADVVPSRPVHASRGKLEHTGPLRSVSPAHTTMCRLIIPDPLHQCPRVRQLTSR